MIKILFLQLLLIPLTATIRGQGIEESIDAAFDYYIYDIEHFQEKIDSIYSQESIAQNVVLKERYIMLKSFFFYPEDDIDSINYYMSLIPKKVSPKNLGFKYGLDGRIQEYYSNYEQAILLYHNALDVLDPVQDKAFITLINLAIGINHYRNFTYEKAQEYCQIAFERGKKYNLQYHIVEALDYMASTYSRLGNEQNADSTWQLFQEYASNIDNAELQFYAVTNLGNSYDAKSQHKLAAEYFEKAFEFSKELNDPNIEREALMYLGEQYAWDHNYEEANRVIELLNSYPINTGRTVVDQRIRHFTALTKAGLNNYKSAFKLLKDHDSIATQYWKINTKERILEYETKYHSAKKDAEINAQQLQISQTNAQRNLLFAGALSLALFTWFLIYRSKKNQKLTEEKIENLENQQKLMALDYMVQGQEKERKRIAQDLHDGLGGMLSAAKIQIQKVQKEIEILEEINLIDQAKILVDNAHQEVRRISHDMMPGALIDLGLVDAIEDLTNHLQNSENIQVIINDDTNDLLLNDIQKVQLYRVLQELINNIVKHAQASSIKISFANTENQLILGVIDDGIGFNHNSAVTGNGLGLKSLQSRISFLNGEIDITSSQGRGSKVIIYVPI